MTANHNASIRLLALLPLLAASLLSGCSYAVIGADQPGPTAEDSPAFLDRVADRSTVSENDALYGLLTLLDGSDTSANFGRRWQTAADRKLVNSKCWDADADRPLTRGKLAYMMYQACNMTGGLTCTIFGPSQRYCLRELQYRHMLPDGLPSTPVTGSEYVAALHTIEKELASH